MQCLYLKIVLIWKYSQRGCPFDADQSKSLLNLSQKIFKFAIKPNDGTSVQPQQQTKQFVLKPKLTPMSNPPPPQPHLSHLTSQSISHWTITQICVSPLPTCFLAPFFVRFKRGLCVRERHQRPNGTGCRYHRPTHCASSWNIPFS